MNKEVIFSIMYCLVTVGAFCAGKFVFPKIPASVKDKMSYLAEWAAKFVVWAREFLKSESGEKKMDAVVDQLKAIAREVGLDVTEDQLKAIVQTAYEAMKAGEAESAIQAGMILEEAVQPLAAPTVVINAGAAVNAYDADGNKVGIASAEATEKAVRNVSESITEGNG